MSGEDSRSPADLSDVGRDDVVRRYRSIMEDVPTDEWFTVYAIMNCLDLHSDRMWRHITSADRARVMIECLLLSFIKDRELLEAFVASSGNAEIEVDSYGRVSRITIEGRRYDLRGRMRNRFQTHGRYGEG